VRAQCRLADACLADEHDQRAPDRLLERDLQSLEFVCPPDETLMRPRPLWHGQRSLGPASGGSISTTCACAVR
jgi:hypothetical protein